MNKNLRADLLAYVAYVGILLRAWTALILGFLTGSTYGVLLLSVSAYVIAARAGVEVLSAGQLLVWFAEQSEGAQVAIGAGVLTALGLVAAYWTAMAAWRTQRYEEIKVATAQKIQDIGQRATRCAGDLNAYFSVLESSVTEAKAAKAQDAPTKLYYSNNQAEHYHAAVSTLHESRMAVSALFASDGNIIFNTFGLFEKLAAARAIVDDAWDACIAFHPPSANPSSPTFVADFVSRYDAKRADNAARACERVMIDASGIVGFVTGRLLQRVLIAGLPAVLTLTREPKFFALVARKISGAKARGMLKEVTNDERFR